MTMGPVPDDQEQELLDLWLDEEFRRRAVSPRAWIHNAWSIRAASKMVWESWAAELKRTEEGAWTGPAANLLVGPVFLMLAGYAIECLAKAIAVAIDRPSVELGSIPDLLKTHNSRELLKRAPIALSPVEVAFLKKLEVYVLWAGRYPTPTVGIHMDLAKSTNTAEGPQFEALFGRIEDVALELLRSREAE